MPWTKSEPPNIMSKGQPSMQCINWSPQCSGQKGTHNAVDKQKPSIQWTIRQYVGLATLIGRHVLILNFF